MPVIAFALMGFVAGLTTMIVVSLYKTMLKIMSN
jgi:hypothetical protein